LTDNTYDLGSAALQWAEIHGVAIYQNGFAVCDSSGANCPAGADFWQLNADVLSPANTTWDVAVGGTGTGSAKFQAFGIENADGNVVALNSDTITTGDVFTIDSTAITSGNMIYLTESGDQGFSGNVIYADIANAGTGAFTGNFLQFDNSGATNFTVDYLGNIFGAGNLVLGDTGTLQVGGETGTAYNSLANIGESPVGAAAIAAITSDNDLFIGGDFQVGGTMFDASGNVVGGYWTLTGNNLYPSDLNNMVGIGTATPESRLSVVNNPAGGSLTGKAAFLVDQYENEDILTASASGVTKLTLENDGTLRLFNSSSSITNDSGDITIDAASNFISFAGDTLINFSQTLGGDGTVGAPTYSFSASPTTGMFAGAADQLAFATDGVERLTITALGSVGIGTTGPDSKLDILDATGAQLRLTHTDGSVFTTFQTDSNGYLQIDPSGSRATIDGSLQVGQLTTPQAYSRFTTSGATTSHAGNLTDANDVLIGGDLEVDGGFYLDGKTIYNTQGTASIILCTGGSGVTCGNTAQLQNTLTAGSWVIDNTVNVGEPALSVNNAKGGDLIVASASGVLAFRVANNGDVFLGDNTGTDLTVGGGTGKIDAGTVDPPYTINGKKYATYMAGMIGIKEEVVGNVSTNEYIPGHGYRYVIDFNNLPEGSDLWLFGKTTDIKSNINELVALLTPSFPTKVWYEVDKVNKRLILYSARPTQISFRLTAPRFDHQNWSNMRDPKSETIGFVINNRDSANSNPIAVALQNLSDFSFEKVQNGFFLLKDKAGNTVDGIESIGSMVAGNIRAGAVKTRELSANSFNAFQGTVDNLLISSGLVSPSIKTGLISPLDGEGDVTIKIGGAKNSGKLAVQNSQGKEVASIDQDGNATFAGEVRAKNIEEIEQILSEVQLNQNLLAQAQDWNYNTATESAVLDTLAVSDLYVTNQGAFNSLSVTNSFTIGADLIISSVGSSPENGNWQVENTLNTLSAPLKLQSLAMAPIEIMAGLVTIDTDGNVSIAGDLYVAGKIETTELNLFDTEGNVVSSLNASGSANFVNVSASQLVISGSTEATNSAIINGVITTDSSVGSGTVKAGLNEITIINPNITDQTLVYITPTSNTQNNVLYVKKKEAGYFKVGFTDPLLIDVSFNWWIVGVE
jgi:hypothetical protein